MSRGKKAAPPNSGAERPPKKTPVLDRLEPWEAQAVLRRLLAAHPNLGIEAEQISKSLLGEISLEIVADDVADAIRSLSLDDLNGRAGRHSWGYVEPSEAAWELLEEAVNPFLEDMKRRMGLGLEAETLEVCKGILLGLYSARDEKAHSRRVGARFSRRDRRRHIADLVCRQGQERNRTPRARAASP